MSFVTFVKAVNYATDKHSGQKRLDGKPYITHPLSVSESVYGLEAKMVAILHDLLEDTDTSLYDIEKLFGESVAQSVSILTRAKGEDYHTYIYRIISSNNMVAIEVKIADLECNLATIDKVSDLGKQIELKEKYLWALKELKKRD